MPCSNRSNKKHFKEERLYAIRFRVSSTPLFVEKTLFFKFCKNEFPQYLFKLIPIRISEHATRSMQKIPFFKKRNNFFKNSFFSSNIIEWNNLHQNIRHSSSLNLFRDSFLIFLRLLASRVINIHNPKGIEF